MKLNKLNDWVKVLGTQLIAGAITIVLGAIYYVVEAPLDMYVLFLFSVLMIIYYVFAGNFLRNVKTYKMITGWIFMFVAAFFVPRYIGYLLTGGMSSFYANFCYFVDDPYKHIEYSFPLCFLAPFIITYISMKISRHRESKLAPYIESVMKENDKNL